MQIEPAGHAMNWTRRAVLASALGLIYLAVFSWFRSHDVWNVSAHVSPGDMITWTALRLAFVACFGLVCITTGRFTLAWQRKNLDSLGMLERALAYFFVGSSVLRLAMFLIGLLGLYKPTVIFVGSLPLLVAFPFLFDVRCAYERCVARAQRNIPESLWFGGLSVMGLAILGTVYFLRCQYSFDHDYLTHYGPYYGSVIANGGLAPNDVWYQYFYSKGAGLFYFSMLMTDRTGPLLVSFLSLTAAATLVYAVMRRASGSALWAMSTAICMLGMLASADSGFFIKHHCETSALILAITCAVVLISASPKQRSLYLFCACILQTSLLVYSLQAGAYTLIFGGAYFAIALYRRQSRRLFDYATLFALAGVVTIVLMLHNYSSTGLYEITPFRIFLKSWNQEVFARWVSPYLMFYLSEGSMPEFGTVGISGSALSFLAYAQLFRFEKLFASPAFIIVGGAICGLGIWSAFTRGFWRHAGTGLFGVSLRTSENLTAERDAPIEPSAVKVPLSGRVLVAQGLDGAALSAVQRNMLEWVLFPSVIMCMVVVIGYVLVQQPVSIYRFSEFVTMYVTMATFSVLIACHASIRQPLLHRAAAIVVPVILAVGFFPETHASGIPDGALHVPLRFAFGKVTPNELAPGDAVLHEQYPAIRKLIEQYGRVVSLNLSTDYGPLFLQNPGIVTEVSYGFGNRWHEIAFGEPAAARKAMQDLGINCVLVDLSMAHFGALSYSPLFAGKSLAANFRIVWQSGSRYMLTWNDGQTPIDAAFVETWDAYLKRGLPALYERVRDLYELNHHATHGIVRPASMEKVKGWQ